MKVKIHAGAGLLSLLLILSFWVMTLVSWVIYDPIFMHLVKDAIIMVFFALIPVLMITGISGFWLAREKPGQLVNVKMRRMRLIALNGIFILFPSALYLANYPYAGLEDLDYMLISLLELAVGLMNIVLLVLNLRDGLKLTGRLQS